MGTREAAAPVQRWQIEGGLRLVLTDEGDAISLEITAEAGEWRIEHSEDGKPLATLTVAAGGHAVDSAWIDKTARMQLVLIDCRSGRQHELDLPVQDAPQP